MLSKKLFLSSAAFFVLVSLLFISSVGASSEMWSQTYESGRFQSAYSLVETSDGGYAIVGESGLDSDFCLLKTDEWGNMQWIKTYGGTNDDRAFSVVETSDGGYAIAGTTESFGAGSFDFWLVKTDVNGSMQWNRTYGGSNLEKAYSLIKTSDGGYAIAGYTQSSGARGSDFWLVKTDSNGNMVWNQTYGGKDNEYAYSVVETSDGGYAVAGGSWLVKIDSQGRTEWDRTYFVGVACSLVKTSDGGYAIFGDGLLIKTDGYGYMVWNQTYGGGDGTKGFAGSLVATSDGGYAFVIGSRLIKTDAQGSMEWSQTYAVERATARRLFSLVETSDGGYALVGYIWLMMSGDTFIWAVKTDAQGIIPEFPSWTILPLLVLTIMVAIIYRKKLYRTQTQQSY
jgi:hypothetical protein